MVVSEKHIVNDRAKLSVHGEAREQKKRESRDTSGLRNQMSRSAALEDEHTVVLGKENNRIIKETVIRNEG